MKQVIALAFALVALPQAATAAKPRATQQRGAWPRMLERPDLTLSKLQRALKTKIFRNAFQKVEEGPSGTTEIYLKWDSYRGRRDHPSMHAEMTLTFGKDGHLVSADRNWSPEDVGPDHPVPWPIGRYNAFELGEKVTRTAKGLRVLKTRYFNDGVQQQISDSADEKALNRFTMGTGDFSTVLKRTLRYVEDTGRPAIIDWVDRPIPVNPEDLSRGTKAAEDEIYRRMFESQGLKPRR